MTYPKIEIGDQIQYKGCNYTIQEIIYQDYDNGYIFEGRTTDGEYRVWKQYYDGGALIKRRKVGESKAEIARELGVLLKMTRQFSDLESCRYLKVGEDQEFVVLTGKPNSEGYRWKYRVNVTWDSGISMIRDVLKQIG